MPACTGFASFVLACVDVVHRTICPSVAVARHKLLDLLDQRRVRAEFAQVLVAHDMAPRVPTNALRIAMESCAINHKLIDVCAQVFHMMVAQNSG